MVTGTPLAAGGSDEPRLAIPREYRVIDVSGKLTVPRGESHPETPTRGGAVCHKGPIRVV